MKNYICLIAFLCSGILIAQTEEQPKKPELEFKVNVRLLFVRPIQFGNTALAKAHESDGGFSGHLNLLDYNGFKAGAGFDWIGYQITDKQMVANLSTSKYSSIYFLLGYEYKPTDKIRITPNIGYGSATLDLGSRGSRFGGQEGTEFRIGGFFDYKIGKSSYASAGITYITNTFEVETAPEYKDFFSKANQIQLSLGFRFGN